MIILDERSTGDQNKKQHVYVLFTHRLAPHARPLTELSLPEGAPVVGAGTARHVSHPWFSSYTCRSPAYNATPEYRYRVETELPTCRETTYIRRRARGESLPHLFTSPYHRIPSRARARPTGVARRSTPPSRSRRSSPPRRSRRSSRFDVPWRDADARGMESPASRSTTVTRADAPGRPAGWLADWLADRLYARG